MKFINKYKEHIIINPLMRGGIVPEDVQAQLCQEGWLEVGYSLCHDCLEGRSSLVSKPPVKSFLGNVAEFFGGDEAEHTFGCRGAQFAVMKTVGDYCKEEDLEPVIVVDPNSHYSTNIAAEMAGLRVVEPPHTGYPEYKVTAEAFEDKIEEVGRPALVAVTHADPYFGNIAPVEEIGKICEERDIPYMVNAAYTAGVAPVNLKKMKAQFLTVSAHKSMSSLAPLGYVVTTYEWSKKIFATSKSKAEWTGRIFGKKLPNLFGCSIGGVPVISSMLSFDYVKERVKHWDEELSKINSFVDRLEEIGDGDIMLLGERPKRHHLLHFETPVFWDISQKHKRRGFFLAEHMIKRKIVGLHKGLSKHIKLSVYGLTQEEIDRVLEAFREAVKLREKLN
ncbi:MAG TPA: aminotransferase class V-fold PLP-dependent enzyme [Euryarchaeota archaeon]|nr:sep-tRNA:Cys-tRNA synthetase [archaeon BMS3Bbin15]HDL15627.1 aminotransferase class V-fold PLP-dependent enzyme [Euryarchaeota archaeon]